MPQLPPSSLLCPQHDASACADTAAADARVALVSACLEVVRHELERTNGLRATMAAALSHHAGALLGDAEGDQTREAAFGIVCALQEDDRIRQRLEGLGEALTIAAAAIAEVSASASSAGARQAAPRQDWAEALLATQKLDELRRSFVKRLTARPITRQSRRAKR